MIEALLHLESAHIIRLLKTTLLFLRSSRRQDNSGGDSIKLSDGGGGGGNSLVSSLQSRSERLLLGTASTIKSSSIPIAALSRPRVLLEYLKCRHESLGTCGGVDIIAEQVGGPEEDTEGKDEEEVSVKSETNHIVVEGIQLYGALWTKNEGIMMAADESNCKSCQDVGEVILKTQSHNRLQVTRYVEIPLYQGYEFLANVYVVCESPSVDLLRNAKLLINSPME